ncbi:MAG TPA: PAS domain-containing protein [Ramlibacter sp.]|uniref:PAS domain-containing protein n=1 Tax=Ramlibacter sp. TaxID=1917967 RepID=UPI002D570217|nr:PAS domain-containing protein [Ramlibacter sp.]HZY19651.1 PAS domain-containing protein [Ramlibacter sp.]
MTRQASSGTGPDAGRPTTSPAGSATPAPRSLPLAWVVVAFALLTGGLVAAALVHLRMEALRSGEKLTRSLTHVIAEQTSRTIQTIDQRLQLVAAQLQGLEAAGPLDEATARATLRGHLTALPVVRAIWMLDPQGRIVWDSDVGNGGVVLADREYFQVHLASRSSAFHVAAPIRSRTMGNWTIIASHAVRSPTGALRGVLVAAIEPAYLRDVWRPIDLGPDGAITLFHRGGRMMARSPSWPVRTGQDFSGISLFTERLPVAPEGIYTGPSGIDGFARVIGYRVLPMYPDLIAAVGVSRAEVLAPWRRSALLAAALWLVAVAAAGLLARQVRRHARRLSESEQRFRDLAQAMPQIVFITDPRGVVQFVNRRWSDATGRPVQAAIGASWHELAHADDAAGVARSLSEAAAAGEPVQRELRLRASDGSLRWQLARAVPVRDRSGAVVAWYGTSTDIHELKMAQERLERQAHLLGIAGRLARLGGWMLDLDTGRLTWSDEAAEVLDMPPGSSPLAEDVLALLRPDSQAVVREAIRACAEQGRPFDLEMALDTPAGRPVWIRSIGQAVRDASGRVVQLQGAQQDITQRVRLLAEIQSLNSGLEERVAQRTRELARQEALFRSLTEQAPQPIWTTDPQGAATFFSRAWYDLVGGAPPRWHGDEWIEVVHPDDFEQLRADWKRCGRKGLPFEGRRRLRARDGTWHTTIFRATAVRNEQGEVAFWIGVENDVTDLMANQEALRLANEQLEAFSSSVSHDLQAPLQRIGSFAQLLEREVAAMPPGGKALHYAQRIAANVEHMREIVTGLLSLARVAKADLVRGRVNLSEMAGEILAQHQAEEPRRQVRWQIEPGMVVQGDARLLRSVLENLLGNAWKFTAQQPMARIDVGALRERGEFFVRDNGAGFDMAHAGKLFGAFERLHRQDEFPGTGIGLATAARIVARHGGHIRAEAQPGLGATFYFSLPVQDAVVTPA